MGTLVMRFGLLAPTVNTDEVWRQLKLGHEHENKLIEIDIKRRDALRDLEVSHGNALVLRDQADTAQKAYKEVRDAMKAKRGKARSKKAVPQEMTDACQRAKEVYKAAREAFQSARKAMREESKAFRNQCDALPDDAPRPKSPQDLVEESIDKLNKQASAECGVYWGTKQLIDRAMQARKSMKSTDDGKPAPGALWDGIDPHNPRFVRWTSEGSLGVQLQNGMGAEELVNDTQLRIGPMTPRKQWSIEKDKRCCPIKPDGKRSSVYRTLIMRVTSTDKGKPVFAEWPMQMHRPLPENCRIKAAAVHVRKRGPRMFWFATITVETTAPVEVTNAHGAVAINVGWRTVDRIGSDLGPNDAKDLRVCVYWDEEGHHGELRLNATEIEAIRRCEQIASTRSKSFDRMKVVMLEWLERTPTIPVWLTQEVETLSSWKSAGRFAMLEQRWMYSRFDGDDEMFGELQAWLAHDKHLWTYESEQRQQGLDRRKDIYRKFACKMSRKYDSFCLIDFDKRKVAKLPKDEDVKAENETARSNRQLAATSSLEEICKQSFMSRRGETRVVNAAGATQTCAVSTKSELFDAAPQIEHACRCGCGMVWDQDLNHAQNVLRWAFDPILIEAGHVTVSRDSFQRQEGRWARLKREKAEKKAKAKQEQESDKVAE